MAPSMSAFMPVAVLFVAASAAGPCCKTCTAPLLKYYSVDRAHGFCGDACMDPNKFWIYKKFEANLTLVDEDHPDCSGQFTPVGTHYTDYDSTVTHGGPGLSVTLDLYAPTGMPDHSCCATPLIQSLNCFGIPGKSKNMTIRGTGPYCCPSTATEEQPCGKESSQVTSEPVAAKADDLVQDDCQTYRKIADDAACGDICLASTIGICPRAIVVTTGGLEAGKCTDAGYTIDKGEQDQQAGPCGTLKIEKWAKAEVIVV